MNAALFQRYSSLSLNTKEQWRFGVATAVITANLFVPTVVVGASAGGDLQTDASLSSIEPVSPPEAELRAHQQQRLAQIPELNVQFDERHIPSILEGQLGQVQASNAEEDLNKLLRDLAPVYKSAGTESFRLMNTQEWRRSGTKVYSLQQRIDGRPILGAELHIQVDSVSNEAERISGVYVPDRGIQKSYSLSSHDAVQAAIEYASKQKGLAVVEFELLEKPELVFVATGQTAKLAWRFPFQLLFSNGTGSWESVAVDANDGSIIGHGFPLPVGLVRKIWNGKGTPTTGDDTIIVSEGGITAATPADIKMLYQLCVSSARCWRHTPNYGGGRGWAEQSC
ncbi:MAG: hypothetical protein ACREVN_03145 [Gammaproteobacteria bacterium]